jgi:hypothetical protein
VAGQLGRQPDVAAQTGVTLFGDGGLLLALAGLAHAGDQARDRADGTKVGETLGVAQAPQDAGG